MGKGENMAPGRDIAQHVVVERTRDAMERGEHVLFEPGFSAAGVNVRADIMARDGDTWVITEVKSSKWPEKDRDREKKFELHVPDVAVQRWVAGEAGVAVGRAQLMYLNPGCRHPDLSNLFTPVDVTERTEPLLLALPAAVSTMHSMLRDAEPPDVSVGEQCVVPDDCPFYDRCHVVLPDHHVSELYYAKKQAARLAAEGKTLISDLSDDDAPNAPAKRQVRAVTAGGRVVEPGLAAALATIRSPVVYLDFETVQLAVPRWPGCAPQAMVTVQFSAHREGFADNVTRSHLAARGGDPRPELIGELIDACAGAASIVVYYEAFEKARIRELAHWFPEQAHALMDIHDRIVDLLPIVRDHVYDPGFHGSFSLKKVLPALVPDLNYSDLAIQDGGAATAGIYRLLFDESPDAETQAALRANLLAYCHRDTEAMVRLVATLHDMVS
jgi:predicted RecB family nuclease